MELPDDEDGDPIGGWRAVCIHAQITQGDSGATTVCKFEVGAPIRSHDSPERISVEEAQRAAADMANRAARDVLRSAHPGEMLAVLCRRFKDVYKLMLRAKFKGANVGECTSKGTETVPFGITFPSETTP